jgi:hypothetical protein
VGGGGDKTRDTRYKINLLQCRRKRTMSGLLCVLCCWLLGVCVCPYHPYGKIIRHILEKSRVFYVPSSLIDWGYRKLSKRRNTENSSCSHL